MAAVDTFEIHINGQGGHGAMPHLTKDPVMAAVAMVQSVQTIVSRNAYSMDELVVSVTQIHTGTADNVIPDTAYICGTVRTFDRDVQVMVQTRLKEIVDGSAAAFQVRAELDYEIGYPATVNAPDETAFALDVAREVAGDNGVDPNSVRHMGAEDFSYMLERRPGTYLFLGQGDTASVHHPAYDFNDNIAPVGASFFARLVEKSAPL